MLMNFLHFSRVLGLALSMLLCGVVNAQNYPYLLGKPVSGFDWMGGPASKCDTYPGGTKECVRHMAGPVRFTSMGPIGCEGECSTAEQAAKYNLPLIREDPTVCGLQDENFDLLGWGQPDEGEVYNHQVAYFNYHVLTPQYDDNHVAQTCSVPATRVGAVDGIVVEPCPFGFEASGDSPTAVPCARPRVDCCIAKGNPIDVARGTKVQVENDFPRNPSSPLEFSRIYSTAPLTKLGLNSLYGLGGLWRHSYQRRLDIVGDGVSSGILYIADNGDTTPFQAGSTGGWITASSSKDRISKIGQGALAKYVIAKAGGDIEIYSSLGVLAGIQYLNGDSLSLEYSDGTSSYTNAAGGTLPSGVLAAIVDSRGRKILIGYDDRSRLVSTRLGDTSVVYDYDTNGRLVSASYADTGVIHYLYEAENSADSARSRYLLTGIVDQNGSRFATFAYNSVGQAVSSEHAGGVYKYSITYSWGDHFPTAGAIDIASVDPLGTSSTATVDLVNGRYRKVSETIPVSTGGSPLLSQMTYDVNGNLAGIKSFDGTGAPFWTCYQYDALRAVEVARVEGVSGSDGCTGVVGGTGALGGVKIKISTRLHTTLPLQSGTARPGRIDYYVYNGEQDPISGLAANCTPSGANRADGSPLPVLCRTIQLATSDIDGHLGFSAEIQSSIPPRIITWTYDQNGHMLTEKSPRTDLSSITTYAYYDAGAADYFAGDMQSSTNPLGKTTTYQKYNAAGQVLQSTDANGVVTMKTYDARGRLASISVGAQTTLYSYDLVGQLKRVTQPDGSYIAFEYDGAHRQTAVVDNIGNRVEYGLDNAGNQIAQNVKDFGGNLASTLVRSMDALGRVRQVTGRQ